MRLEKSTFDSPETNQHQNGERCRRHGENIETETASDADYPGQPDAGARGRVSSRAPLVQEDARAEDADSRDETLQQAADIARRVVSFTRVTAAICRATSVNGRSRPKST